MQPVSIGIRDAKINLSKLLKAVQRGGEVILTDRGRPVGKIVPIEKGSLPLAEKIERLKDQGLLVSLPKRRRKKIPPPLPVPHEAAQRFLKEERERGKG